MVGAVQNARPGHVKPNRWKCEMCNVSLNSEVAYNQHLVGKKHQNNGTKPPAGKTAKQANKGPGDPPVPIQNRSPFSERHFTKPPFKAWKCDICKISLNSEFQYQEHMNSKKHLDVEMGIDPSKTRKASTSETNKEPRNSPRNPVSILKNNPSSERHFTAPPFKCEICKISMNSALQYQEHMNSKKHQEVAMGITPSPTKKSSISETNEEARNPPRKPVSILKNNPSSEKHSTTTRPALKAWKCDICEISMNSDFQYHEHMNSKKHQDVAMGITPSQTKKPPICKTNEEPQNPPENPVPILKNNPSSEKHSTSPPLKAWKCDICEISMNSDFQYQEHLNSKKHQDVKMGIYPSPTNMPSIYDFQISATIVQQLADSTDCFTEDILPMEEGFFSQETVKDYPGKSGLIPSSEDNDSSIPEKTDEATNITAETKNDSASTKQMDVDLASMTSPKKRDVFQNDQAQIKQLRQGKLRQTSASTVSLLKKRPAPSLAEESEGTPPVKVPAFKCDDCNCLLNSKIQLQEHLNSKSHKLIATRINLETLNYKQMFSGKRVQTSEDKANLSLRKTSTALDVKNTAALTSKSSPKKEFKCGICKRTMNSEFQFLEHLNSNNHKKKSALTTVTDHSIRQQLQELRKKYQQMQKTSALSNQDLQNQKLVFSLLQERGRAPTPGNLWKKCDTCNLIFKSDLQYNEHVKSKNHKIALSRKPFSKNQDLKKGPKSEGPPSKNSKKKCFACDIMIPFGYQFKQHLNSVSHKMTVSRNISQKIEDLKKKLEYVSKELPQGPGNFIPASLPMTNNSQKAFAWRQKTSEIMRNSDSQFFQDNRRLLPPPGTRRIPINAPSMNPGLPPMEVQMFEPILDPGPLPRQQMNCERRVDAPPGILPVPHEWNTNQEIHFERRMDGPPGILRAPNNQQTNFERPINAPSRILQTPNEFGNNNQPINFEGPFDAPPGILQTPFDFNKNSSQPINFERRTNAGPRTLPPPNEWYQKQPRSAGMLLTPNEKNNFQNFSGGLQNVPGDLQNVPHRWQQFPEKEDHMQSTFRKQELAMVTDGTPFSKARCDICNVTVNSQFQYTEHLRSKKHTKNVEMRSSQTANLPPKPNFMREPFGSQSKIFKRCEICDFTLESESQYIQHIESERHKLKAEIKLREQWSTNKAPRSAIRRLFEGGSRYQNFQNEPISYGDVTRRAQDLIPNSESERWKQLLSEDDGNTVIGVNPPREMWTERQYEDPNAGFRLQPPPLPPTVLRRGQF